MLLNELTWMQVRDLVRKNPVVIQPVGSTEQHGPHLPLQVDITSAYEVARAVGERTGCLVAPPLPYGRLGGWGRCQIQQIPSSGPDSPPVLPRPRPARRDAG